PSNITPNTSCYRHLSPDVSTSAPNATSINIQRSSDGTNFTPLATAGPATTNYLDSGLTAGTAYYYRVAAANAGGNSAYSNTSSRSDERRVGTEGHDPKKRRSSRDA